MMGSSLCTRTTGLLTCGTAVAAFVSLRFSRSVIHGMLERLGVGDADLPRLAAFALAVTSPAVLIGLLVACLVAVAAAEVAVTSGGGRLTVQVAVLLVLMLVLAVALSGFLIPFYVPDVHID